MVKQFDLDKARRLKQDGSSYAQIRSYLSNAGVQEVEINLIIKALDDEEIHLAFRKQQLVNSRAQFIASLILLLVAACFSGYQYITQGKMSVLALLVPLVISGGFYAKYRQVKSANYSVREIIRHNRRNV